ncbi:hypothetical protein AMTR_s00062p00134350 [Amborella trichopoda]|uniref:Uncharacterized protein n=1 Tax=Amborella trichopoda TaxID=13333 RepID=U5DAS8_AMBTC|nr:hypothetical protein AMTR_s00062p00134350 [Amborella trichopoda]
MRNSPSTWERRGCGVAKLSGRESASFHSSLGNEVDTPESSSAGSPHIYKNGSVASDLSNAVREQKIAKVRPPEKPIRLINKDKARPPRGSPPCFKRGKKKSRKLMANKKEEKPKV